jgi:putative YphP/YqiW family bacilliredoxin
MPYPEEMVRPMRDDLTRLGVEELRTADEVDTWFANKEGSAVLIVNSVCGCAGGNARPGFALSLDNDVKPDRMATVFAGQDLEATATARNHFADVPPSSPSMFIFKDGELVHVVPRHFIEMRDANGVAAELKAAYSHFFAATAE